MCIKNIIFLGCQYCLPKYWLTRLFSVFAHCKWRLIKDFMIKAFINRYQIDLSILVEDQLSAYVNFNAFFTRALKPDARAIDCAIDSVVSPVDGCIAQIGKLEQNLLLQAKGKYFRVDDLLATKTNDFAHGSFVTFYLSPRDYHRVHMPIDGRLKCTTYIPGKLFSVNKIATTNINNIFARNERLVCYFDTALGTMVLVFVGAMLVGNITTVWGQTEQSKFIKTTSYPNDADFNFVKGAELGRFNMGSSVILLFIKDSIVWRSAFIADKNVCMGEKIALINHKVFLTKPGVPGRI